MPRYFYVTLERSLYLWKFLQQSEEHMLYLNNTSSLLSDHEKARNENKSLQLNKRRNGILERRINDKTPYIVNHCMSNSVGKDQSWAFYSRSGARPLLTLIKAFFNNFLFSHLCKCHLLTSGFTIYYKSMKSQILFKLLSVSGSSTGKESLLQCREILI